MGSHSPSGSLATAYLVLFQAVLSGLPATGTYSVQVWMAWTPRIGTEPHPRVQRPNAHVQASSRNEWPSYPRFTCRFDLDWMDALTCPFPLLPFWLLSMFKLSTLRRNSALGTFDDLKILGSTPSPTTNLSSVKPDQTRPFIPSFIHLRRQHCSKLTSVDGQGVYMYLSKTHHTQLGIDTDNLVLVVPWSWSLGPLGL